MLGLPLLRGCGVFSVRPHTPSSLPSSLPVHPSLPLRPSPLPLSAPPNLLVLPAPSPMSADARVHGLPSLAAIEPCDRQRARTPDAQSSGGGLHLQAFSSPQADPAVSSGSFASRLLGVSGSMSLGRAGGGGRGGGGGTELEDHSDSWSRSQTSFANASAGAGGFSEGMPSTAQQASSPVVLSNEDVAEGVGERLGSQGVHVRMRACMCVCVRVCARLHEDLSTAYGCAPEQGLHIRAIRVCCGLSWPPADDRLLFQEQPPAKSVQQAAPPRTRSSRIRRKQTWCCCTLQTGH